MIVIVAAFKSEVKKIIRMVGPCNRSQTSVAGNNYIGEGYLHINGKEQKIIVCITGMGADKALESAKNIMELKMKKAADNLNDFAIKEIIPFIHKEYFLNYK